VKGYSRDAFSLSIGPGPNHALRVTFRYHGLVDNGKDEARLFEYERWTG
jgi:hypothetical protein